MRRTAPFFVLASTLGLLACSDSLADPAGLTDMPPEVEPPLEQLPRVPATAAIAFVSTRDGAEHIYVANADGSEVTRVMEGSSPAWSWDGRKIALVRKASSAGPAGIYVMNSDGSQLRYLAGGQNPAWSPDGRILLTRVRGWLTGYDLYVMNGDGSDLTQLFSSPETTFWDGSISPFGVALPGRAAWSPDGRSFAYRAGGIVWIRDSVGSNVREFEELPDDLVSDPAWSPDGSRIAFATHPGPWQICDWWSGCRPGPGMGKSSAIHSYHLASADWEVIDAISPATAVLAANPDWSPDGSQLVFDLRDLSTVCLGYPCPTREPDSRRIFTLSVATGEVRRLIADAANPTVAEYEDYGPVWSRATH